MRANDLWSASGAKRTLAASRSRHALRVMVVPQGQVYEKQYDAIRFLTIRRDINRLGSCGFERP